MEKVLSSARGPPVVVGLAVVVAPGPPFGLSFLHPVTTLDVSTSDVMRSREANVRIRIPPFGLENPDDYRCGVGTPGATPAPLTTGVDASHVQTVCQQYAVRTGTERTR